MAAAAVLPPEVSMSTSQGADVSLARHRRRQSNRRSGTIKSLRQRELGDSTLKLSHLEASVHHPDHNNSELTHTTETVDTDSTTTPIDAQKEKTLGETARQRRSRSRRKDHRKLTISKHNDGSQSIAPSHGNIELEDSTAGVASLLQKKLSQSELEESQSDQIDGSTIISNPAVETEQQERTTSDIISPPQPGGGEPLHPDVQETAVDGTVADRPLPQLAPVINGTEVLNEPEATNEILGITIHGCDALRASVHISHPCVRVSIVDISEEARGSYAKKSHRDKCVMSFYERGNPNVDYIMPILTQPFECKEQGKSLLPMWDETLVFNEHPTHFTTNENLIIFFEIVDFSTLKRSTHSQVGFDASSPWYRIAWAFACPAGKIGNTNMEQKCRLQLHRYPKGLWNRSIKDLEVFDLWTRNYRVNYPSTLYVTLKAIPTEELGHTQPLLQPNIRSMLPTQQEEGSVSYEQLVRSQQTTKGSSNRLTQSAVLSASARLPNQACHIPSTVHATVHPTRMGCSALAFSHSGTLLASGCADQDVHYPIVIFEVPSFKPLLVTEGHRGIIYSVCWKQDDQLLASASADGLVKLWSLEGAGQEPVATLPHPCYVYSVCFASRGLLFTGAYDSNIRLWSITSGSPQLVSELHGCSGLVNCLVWSRRDKLLYSGDSKGRVVVWKEDEGEWSIQRIISAINNCALTAISLHPNGRRLLLHTDKGKLVMIDLRIDRVCCEYKGLVVSQSQRFSSLISPCGGLLFAGGASGEVHVWNSDSGKHLHSYSDLPFKHCAMCAMDYHPSEHMLVLSAFGTHEPIVALTHLMQQQQQGTVAKNLGSQLENTSAIPPQDSTQLRMTQKLNEVTKTLNRVTTKSKRKQNH